MTTPTENTEPCYTDRNGWEMDTALTPESFEARACPIADHDSFGPEAGQWVWFCGDHAAGGYANSLAEADGMAGQHFDAVEILVESGELDEDEAMHDLHVWRTEVDLASHDRLYVLNPR